MNRLHLPVALSASAALVLSTIAATALAVDTPTDLSSVQANGTPEPIRQGLFFETSLGAFLTVGGDDQYSSAEAFLGLGVGYDIIRDLSIGVQFRLAPSVADCYATAKGGGSACAAGATASGTSPPSTFTLISLEGKIAYRIPVSERLFIPIRVFGGITLLTPDPSSASGSTVFYPSFGGATGIEWATPFSHFSLGAEVSADYVLTLGALALAVYPTVKYTF